MSLADVFDDVIICEGRASGVSCERPATTRNLYDDIGVDPLREIFWCDHHVELVRGDVSASYVVDLYFPNLWQPYILSCLQERCLVAWFQELSRWR